MYEIINLYGLVIFHTSIESRFNEIIEGLDLRKYKINIHNIN